MRIDPTNEHSYGADQCSPGLDPGHFTEPQRPQFHDGIDAVALHGGGTITCPIGTAPTVSTDGKTVGVKCKDKEPGPILDF
jgi:hypothetical protein